MRFQEHEVCPVCFIWLYDTNHLSVDDLGFAISTSYPRGGTQIGLHAGSPRECQLWIKAIQEAQLQCIDAENRHLKRQSRAVRSSMG